MNHPMSSPPAKDPDLLREVLEFLSNPSTDWAYPNDVVRSGALGGAERSEQPARCEHGNRALQRVDEKAQDSPRAAQRAAEVRRAIVPAAHGAEVDAARAREEMRRGEAADEVGRDRQHRPEERRRICGGSRLGLHGAIIRKAQRGGGGCRSPAACRSTASCGEPRAACFPPCTRSRPAPSWHAGRSHGSRVTPAHEGYGHVVSGTRPLVSSSEPTLSLRRAAARAGADPCALLRENHRNIDIPP